VLLSAEQPTLAELTLSGGTDRRLTLAEVFALMDAAFNEVRDIVAGAEAGWSGEARRGAARGEAARIASEAETLGYGSPAALDGVDTMIDEAATLAETDPLACRDAAKAIENRLAEADRTLAAARADRQETERCLRDAERRLNGLADRFARATATRAERIAHIADPLPEAALPADPRADLHEWLDRLNRTAAEGRAKAALIGARSWAARVAACEAALQACIDADRRVLDARQDLRGRFSALKAKADDLARQQRLDPAAADVLRQTRELLFGRPTPLPRAAHMMRRCELI
jgi:hypothetical protein